ncbi:phosphatase PAP2 family protein [Fusibacter sp. 3D3]|uniref:phosphatase PAP2 family protein n=1 Tax=Fusibacter sp. 3D3 TaxID=1048380 RepID=UPI0008537C0B|nr:phosphatase PAP2 family protein [Fusibacter sp. 3D3]GAU76249.1 PAP2 family protein [Fusibacter sp. 3D3]
MKNIRFFLSQNKHFYLCFLLLPLLIWFKYLEITIVPHYIIHTALDDQIPFIKAFVIPYLLWFPYMIYGVAYVGFHSKRDFYKVLIFLAGGMSVAYIAYMLFPNAQDLRPVITGNDPFAQLVRFLYATDTPTNVCPSIHVMNSIAINASLHHSEAFKTKKLGLLISSITAVMICLSTLFIKQHSVIDAACGLLVSIVFYMALYPLPKLRKQLKTTPELTPADGS